MKINLEIVFNSANAEAFNFAECFKHDLSFCLNRFKYEVQWTNADSEADYRFIALSGNDFNNQGFIDKLQLDKCAPTHMLLSIDNIEAAGRFKPHRFLCFQFWDRIAETGEVRLFNKKDSSVKPLYWEQITDIAVEISERRMADDYTPENTIYLAQTDNSQMSEWLNIKRDLNDIGSRVLPSKQLSTDYQECSAQIDENIRRCGILVHLIPTTYSRYFQDKKISIAELQLNLSSAIMAENGNTMRRIIWIPSDYEFSDEENQIFIEKIQRDQNQTHNTSILKVNLEDLKRAYRRILAGLDTAENTDSSKLPDIYLISDQTQTPKNNAIKLTGIGNGLKVETNYNGISYNEHLHYLANAQVIVLNYTNENMQWIKVKVDDIIKSPGLETSKPNKKLILIKNDSTLNTNQFESVFDEIKVVDSDEIKLDIS